MQENNVGLEMSGLAKFIKSISNCFRREDSANLNSGYQLWLEDLGDKPEEVAQFLIEDMLIAGAMEELSDIPSLPWEIIELPAGSDTYSLIHIKAGELEKLGATVSIKGVQENARLT